MELLQLLFLSSVSILLGIILTLVVQYYVLLKYFNKNPTATPPRKPHAAACSLPENLKRNLDSADQNNTDSSLAISLMFQFLFHELRHSDSIKRWLYKKLSLEFEELIAKTTTGKFFEAVTIRDMHLGSQFPDIKTIGVENVKLDNAEGHIDTLNLCVKLEYDGNFLLSVDAKMKFGKTAYLSIKVKHISGLARLQFTRLPYTHWSFSFYKEPVLELAVESHFQGRQLQSNITNLIVNQIKKAIKRKHTLPNYKIRYKPFFVKMDPGQLDTEDNEIVPQGQLEVMCMEMSRLATTGDIIQIHCTFAIDSLPWICVYQIEAVTYMILEVTLSKVRQQQIGVTFKQEQNVIMVDCVTTQTSIDKTFLKSGDVVLAIEGKTISNVAQLNKLLKLLPIGNFSIRIERIVSNYILKTKHYDKTDLKTPLSNTNSIIEDDQPMQTEEDSLIANTNKSKLVDQSDTTKKSKISEKTKSADKIPIPKLISASNENVSRFAQTIGNFSLRKRKTSIERMSSDSSSSRNTSTVSTPTTPSHSTLKQYTIPVPSVPLLAAKRQNIQEASLEEPTSSGSSNVTSEVRVPPTDCIEIFKGNLKETLCVVNCDDECCFNLKESDKYLNVNVWGTTDSNKEVLLGYINIPLAQILNECNNSLLGHYIKSYSFLPPTSTPPNSQSHPLMSHSGFEHVFCYGDTLLSFMWTHDEVAELKRKVSQPTNASEIAKQISTSILEVRHDFVRTQFHRTTHCDFCSKKIWLKDAVQCRNCDLCCHKKCVTKCQTSTPCIPIDKSEQKAEPSDTLQPEITMTKVEDDDLECENEQYSRSEQKQGSFGLKRVNSANNLAIPGSHFFQCQSRSLPPSPQHTPRKLSLVANNPFATCPAVLDEIQQQLNDAPEIILKMVDQMLQYPIDEALMDAAKETGTQMYISMSHELKVERINLMVIELKKTLDTVTVEHMTLTKQLGIVESEVEKAKLAFLIGQADSKIQALSVLMLHYCSGLQHAQDKII